MDDFNGGNRFDNESDHLAVAFEVSHASLECKVLTSKSFSFIFHARKM